MVGTTEEKYAARGSNFSVERLHAEALAGESFEDATTALKNVEILQGFRKKVSDLPFGAFWELVEEATNLNKLRIPETERLGQLENIVEAMEQKAARFSPRVADLFLSILSKTGGRPYEPKFDLTREKIVELEADGDFGVLFSAGATWDMKFNRIETRLVDYLSGMRAMDKREGKTMDDDTRKWREEELKKTPTNPPQRRNESRPGVDPMDRLKEGERAPAIWSIYPAWGGYYKEQSFSKWDSNNNVWAEEKYSYQDVETVPLSGNLDHKKGPIDIIMSARTFAGSWVSLPVPYTHGLHKVEAGGKNSQVRQDQNGDLVIYIEGNVIERVNIKVFLAPHPDKKFKSIEPGKIKPPTMPAEFSEETNNKLEEIKNKKRGNIARARALASYTRSRIAYLAPNDFVEAEQYNNIYRTSPKGFAGAVDELKKADCDVANTYFAALCAKLNIPARHCVGHSVKGKDANGASNINSGTGHGWSEVWDEIKKEWIRIDATPPGDPNLEEEKQKGGESAPGDYGEHEAVRSSDDKLEELRKKLAERKEKLSYTKEERQLAEATGVELKEARQIVKEISEAENTRLPSGELVTEVLGNLFDSIVQSRKRSAPADTGPARRSEGGMAISHLINHVIGMKVGDPDPASREKPTVETKEAQTIGGFDVYIIGDKSGSMSSAVNEEFLWQIQRRAIYLIFSALYRFEQKLEHAHLEPENNLLVRTEGISFRGLDMIDLDKPLSVKFTAQDKVKLWHGLTNHGGGNGDVAALSYIYEQIKKEIETTTAGGKKNNRLRVVIACSDGGYVGSEEQMRLLAEELGKLKVVVVGLGLTETAASVPVVMENPPHSRGCIVRDINDLPVIIARHVIMEAIKLFPEKAKADAVQFLNDTIVKFKK